MYTFKDFSLLFECHLFLPFSSVEASQPHSCSLQRGMFFCLPVYLFVLPSCSSNNDNTTHTLNNSSDVVVIGWLFASTITINVYNFYLNQTFFIKCVLLMISSLNILLDKCLFKCEKNISSNITLFFQCTQQHSLK